SENMRGRLGHFGDRADLRLIARKHFSNRRSHGHVRCSRSRLVVAGECSAMRRLYPFHGHWISSEIFHEKLHPLGESPLRQEMDGFDVSRFVALLNLEDWLLRQLRS